MSLFIICPHDKKPGLLTGKNNFSRVFTDVSSKTKKKFIFTKVFAAKDYRAGFASHKSVAKGFLGG